MRPSFFFALVVCCCFLACNNIKKTTNTPPNASSVALINLANKEIEDMAAFALEKTIEQLQTAIPINDQQGVILQTNAAFQQLLEENKKELTTWFSKRKEKDEGEKKEAIACLEQARPMAASCSQNKIIQQLLGEVFTEIVHDVSNYSIQLAIDKNWIPNNEAGYDCESVKKGNFYYYMPGGSNEVVYLTRTEDSQKESLEGDMTNRKVTWTGDCSYSLTAWEEDDDDFQLDFEIVHVASDHYLFLCEAPYKGKETTLLLGRVNKSLE